MNKEGIKTRYFVQWDTHARHMCTLLCSLMEHQSLVDLAICCGTNTIHAHKCVLAANSPYFREQLEKNAGTEQIVINGLDFVIVKSIIEFMYCGETNILDENLKYMIAAAKLFQMRGLQTLVSDRQDIRYEADSIHIPFPMFLPKKPKYPNAYRPVHNPIQQSTFTPFKSPVQNDTYLHKKVKRKFVRSEAEKACAKEAAASRLALEALQKELATTTQMNSFVIEESCTETTVENFIPHTEETFIDNLNRMECVPLQVVNYEDLTSSIMNNDQIINVDKPECVNNTLQFGMRGDLNKEKLKRILGSNISGNIEIMYRTNDGDFVNVTADVLQNLSGDALQYQIVDENGQIREIRELQEEEQNNSASNYNTPVDAPPLDALLIEPSNNSSLITTSNDNYISCSNIDIVNSNELLNKNQVTDTVMDNFVENLASHHEENSESINGSNVKFDIIENAIVTSNSVLYCSSNNNSQFSTVNMQQTESHTMSYLSKLDDAPYTEDNSICDTNDVNRFLNINNDIVDNPLKECNFSLSMIEHTNSDILKVPNLECNTNLQTLTSVNTNDNSLLLDTCLQNNTKWCDNKGNSIDMVNETENMNTMHGSPEQDVPEDSDYPYRNEKRKFTLDDNSTLFAEAEEVDIELMENISDSVSYSPRKTRSGLTIVDENCQNSSNICQDVRDDYIKYDKPRRIMPSRKKKSI